MGIAGTAKAEIHRERERDIPQDSQMSHYIYRSSDMRYLPRFTLNNQKCFLLCEGFKQDVQRCASKNSWQLLLAKLTSAHLFNGTFPAPCRIAKGIRQSIFSAVILYFLPCRIRNKQWFVNVNLSLTSWMQAGAINTLQPQKFTQLFKCFLISMMPVPIM